MSLFLAFNRATSAKQYAQLSRAHLASDQWELCFPFSSDLLPCVPLVRDHDQVLSLLVLPPQPVRDAWMPPSPIISARRELCIRLRLDQCPIEIVEDHRDLLSTDVAWTSFNTARDECGRGERIEVQVVYQGRCAGDIRSGIFKSTSEQRVNLD